MSEIENKLDEDFLFYLGFTSNYSLKITDCAEAALVKLWLQRLCGEVCTTLESKRNRNIFLSNLLLQMQDGNLLEPFTQNPQEVDYADATKYFQRISKEIEAPGWLSELNGQQEDDDDPGAAREDGRTYVATRAMPGGEGAFAYVAVSLTEEEKPAWLGGGEGVFDAEMQRNYKAICPPPNEMEAVLARRKDAKERQRVLTFYDVMLQNIADELDGKIDEEHNRPISVIIEQLVADLQSKGQYESYEEMDDKERRTELLLLLFDRTKARRNKVATREEILDEVEATFRASIFEQSHDEDDEKYEMPSAMWEYVINRPPAKKNLDLLQEMYPTFVVEKFMELLADDKEGMAMMIQRRHENIVSQMRRDLKKEGEKLNKWVEDAKIGCDQAADVLKAIRVAMDKQKQSMEEANKRKKGGETEKTKLYNEMRSAVFSTQHDVEEEAERGRILSEQINELNVHSEIYHQVTKCAIMKTEEANMETMRNIKRLKAAVKQHESRLHQIKSMEMKETQDVFFF